MRKRKSKTTTRSSRSLRNTRSSSSGPATLTFIAHARELRRRVFYIALAIGLFAGIAYSVEDQLTRWLLLPAAGQQFIYTTPGGGFDFLFKLCLYSGLAASIPVVVYNLFRYLSPLFQYDNQKFMLKCTLWSSILAMIGISFGYFIGLPAAMHFLLQSFSSEQISALITIQSYMSFVLVYLFGSALLFQLPLILLLTNRFKPLSPRKLMSYQRYVIVGAFIVGAIISPTPDIRNQALLSGPIILMYQLSLSIIWYLNKRHGRTPKVAALFAQDLQTRQERLQEFEAHQARLATALQKQAQSAPTLSMTAKVQVAGHQAATPIATSVANIGANTNVTASGGSLRPRQYLQDFNRPAYGTLRRQIS